MPTSRFLRADLALAAALLCLAAGCGGDADSAAAATPGANGRAGGGAGAPGGRGGRGGGAITLSESDLAVVHRAPIEEGTPITGNLNPIETVDVRARLEGDIVRVLAREGQRVSEGELLAQYESSEQESARRSAEARAASARAELSTAEWTLQQSEELFKAGAIAERDLRAAQNAVTSSKAQVAAAESELRATSSSASDTRIVAPLTGTVATRSVEVGEHVARGSTLFTVVRSDVLELAASVAARNANGLLAGQVVRFTADGRDFQGRVARISPTIDPATRSITVYIQVPNEGGRLKGGTFATGRVVGRTIPDALVIPAAAVKQTGEGTPFVFRLDGSTLAQVEIQLGVVDEAAGVVQVVSGLAEGDRIIVGNVGSLGKGMQVQVVGTAAP
jgi:RND family efflux transporter MFP subunit